MGHPSDQDLQNQNSELEQTNWITVTKLFPPDDIIVESLLKFHDIPVRLIRREISGFPFSTGPLAEVIIAVPQEMAAVAYELIKSRNAGV